MTSKIRNLFTHARWTVTQAPADVLPAILRLARFAGRAASVRLRRVLAGRASNYVVHAAIHVTGNNIGDVALTYALRSAFDRVLGAQTWYCYPLWRAMRDLDVATFNQRARGVIVGGHGLLTPDTMAHISSGWQWNIEVSTLRKLRVPLIVFAVGYNRFRDQEDFSESFVRHINETVRQSVFFGLRNTGSVEKVREYLEPSLREKVTLQPCPTTVLARHYPAYKPYLRDDGVKRLAVNVAFDRMHLRVGANVNDYERRLQDIARVIAYASDNGWQIHLANHAHEDGFLIPYLRERRIRFRCHWFARRHPDDVVDFYTRMPLTLGMRGHSQMIPFGCGNAIIPLIAHDKLVYFLRDIGHPEWGVEVNDVRFVDQAIARIEAFERDRPKMFDDVERAQQRLWSLTEANIRTIGGFMSRQDGGSD